MVGFAGGAADALALMERLEARLEDECLRLEPLARRVLLVQVQLGRRRVRGAREALERVHLPEVRALAKRLRSALVRTPSR